MALFAMVHHVAAHGWPRSSKKTRHLCFLFDMNIAAAKFMYTRPKSIGQKYLDRVTMNGHAYTSSSLVSAFDGFNPVLID